MADFTMAVPFPEVEDVINLHVDALVQMGGHKSSKHQLRKAALGFAHFSATPEGQKQIMDYHGTDDAVLTLLDVLAYDDVFTQRSAALALGNLAATEDCRATLVRVGAIDRLLAVAASVRVKGAADTQASCVFAVANLAANSAVHDRLEKSLPSLIALITSNNRDTQKHASLVARNLSTTKRMVEPLIDAGVLTAMLAVQAKASAHPHARVYCYSTLHSLCANGTAEDRPEELGTKVRKAMLESGQLGESAHFALSTTGSLASDNQAGDRD